MPTNTSRKTFPHPVKAGQRVVFYVKGESIALNDLLKLTGVCASGGAGKALVATGEVEVDGQRELRKTCKIRAGQEVHVGSLWIDVLQSPDEAASVAPPDD